jgi:hypothetical protein
MEPLASMVAQLDFLPEKYDGQCVIASKLSQKL